jgi:hypothetical protein
MIMDKALGIFLCVPHSDPGREGEYRITEYMKYPQDYISGTEPKLRHIIDCYTARHYLYEFLGMIMFMAYYPVFLMIYPYTQFEKKTLDIKIQPVFYIWYSVGTLV